jgi:hypothetical protein
MGNKVGGFRFGVCQVMFTMIIHVFQMFTMEIDIECISYYLCVVTKQYKVSELCPFSIQLVN